MVRYSFYDANCAAIESLPMGPCLYSVYDNMHVQVQNKHTITMIIYAKFIVVHCEKILDYLLHI